MKTVEQAWREHGVDEDMPVHDFFLAGWDAAIEAMAGVQEQLDLALGTLESREREIEMILAESARRQEELDSLKLKRRDAWAVFSQPLPQSVANAFDQA